MKPPGNGFYLLPYFSVSCREDEVVEKVYAGVTIEVCVSGGPFGLDGLKIGIGQDEVVKEVDRVILIDVTVLQVHVGVGHASKLRVHVQDFSQPRFVLYGKRVGASGDRGAQ